MGTAFVIKNGAQLSQARLVAKPAENPSQHSTGEKNQEIMKVEHGENHA
jgi:hypothetical protein